MKDLNSISGPILDAAFHIHSRLGPGLLESVNEVLLAHELENRGLKIDRQKPVPIEFEGIRFEGGVRAGLIVENCVVIEPKSVEKLSRVHSK